jgi:AcrR family transcriptional regulator
LPRGLAQNSRADVSEAILDAVDVLLARYGYKKMGIEDVAAEVGIGKGTVYLHFRSKEDIVLSYVDRLVARLCERLEAIARQELGAAERLRRMLVERVMYRFDAVKHYSRSLSELLADVREGLLERRRRHFAQEIAILAGVLREGRRGGELGFAKAEDAAEALVLATNSLLPFSLSVRELGSRAQVERKAEALADVLLQGILRRS